LLTQARGRQLDECAVEGCNPGELSPGVIVR
jgi:hypothetical protein